MSEPRGELRGDGTPTVASRRPGRRRRGAPSDAARRRGAPSDAARRRRRAAAPYVLILPAALYLLGTMAFPLLEGARLSMTDTSLLNPRGGEYVGGENYGGLLTDTRFLRTIWITFVYTVASVLGALSAGMVAALAMNALTGRGRMLRGLVMIPWAAPIIPVALVFGWMLDNQFGVLTYLVNQLGVFDQSVRWLDDPSTALPSIMAVTIWRIFPFSAVIILAALQGIPRELYEAARMDGAGLLNRFRQITLPTIAPTLSILTLFITIWSLRRFDLIWVLTQGGPLRSTTTLVIDLYREAFRHTNLGPAAAIGMTGFAIATLLTGVYFVLQTRQARRLGASDVL